MKTIQVRPAKPPPPAPEKCKYWIEKENRYCKNNPKEKYDGHCYTHWMIVLVGKNDTCKGN